MNVPGKVSMRKNITAFLALLLVIITEPCYAQDFSAVDHWMKDHVRDMGGRAVLMVWKDGKLIYSHAENNMSRRQKMGFKIIARRQGKTADLSDFAPSTRIPLASCSKWFSAALVMTFVDEGKLNLTDTLGKFLPVLSASGKGNITISQCLSHTTGIKAPPLRENLQEMRNISSMSEAVEAIATMPMEGTPGKVFHYSNTGLQLAGAVLEKISGKDFETLFAERLALPLEMEHTDFGKGRVALPAGGAQGTTADYMHFLEMILNNGEYNGKRILSEKSIRELQTNRITDDVKITYSPAEAGSNIGYGYGEWILEEDDHKTVASPGLFGSYPWVNPGKNYCAFLLTLYLWSKDRHERYLDLKKVVEEAF